MSSPFLLAWSCLGGSRGRRIQPSTAGAERKGRVLGAQAHPGLSLLERHLLEVKYERISGPIAPLQPRWDCLVSDTAGAGRTRGDGCIGRVSAGLWMQPRLPLEGETPSQTLRFRKPGCLQVLFSPLFCKTGKFT